MVAERKFVLTKVRAGDYLLPSNDGRTIWRLVRRIDGPSCGLDDCPRDRAIWGLYRWDTTYLSLSSVCFVDVEDWDRWILVGDWFDTRADAINEAMQA